MKHLYRRRWQVELGLRNLKTTLGMDQLSCKSPAMVEKEIWVYLLAYNLIRLSMSDAAQISGCQPCQISFKHTLQLWLLWDHHANGETRTAADVHRRWCVLVAHSGSASVPVEWNREHSSDVPSPTRS